MELSIGEMLMVALVIVVLFGPNKLPQIARDLGQGVRKMRGAMEDVKTEILKETDNPVSEIKREIEKVKKAAMDFNPMADLEKEAMANRDEPKVNLSESETHEGPVSR
ncbi:Sec-independent protein translocase subunit TatA/TatB [Kaistella antarctica]|uniref:Sec-independent protein translocase protein TatA n=1 Tax=Kaistella antarctica TaxID=266748 RepID=A0A3S4UPB0_9FLAO|nr:twin-arginine translocase TatA/TatE family subunit [Kaistella antarctica]KEY20053.1 preprotein translocase [Kaistella antarctica]SEV94311.1 sec-independent protein translocase protein TatB [Kaistella antarctica]VEH95547.1 Sec-independent protein translocase protein TatA [Kaistella antarctica]